MARELGLSKSGGALYSEHWSRDQKHQSIKAKKRELSSVIQEWSKGGDKFSAIEKLERDLARVQIPDNADKGTISRFRNQRNTIQGKINAMNAERDSKLKPAQRYLGILRTVDRSGLGVQNKKISLDEARKLGIIK